eukprot:1745189-Heterocapsa_arctica.AAC.1
MNPPGLNAFTCKPSDTAKPAAQRTALHMPEAAKALDEAIEEKVVKPWKADVDPIKLTAATPSSNSSEPAGMRAPSSAPAPGAPTSSSSEPSGMRAPSLAPAPALGPSGPARWAIFAATLAARLRYAEAFCRVRAHLRLQAELREA